MRHTYASSSICIDTGDHGSIAAHGRGVIPTISPNRFTGEGDVAINVTKGDPPPIAKGQVVVVPLHQGISDEGKRVPERTAVFESTPFPFTRDGYCAASGLAGVLPLPYKTKLTSLNFICNYKIIH